MPGGASQASAKRIEPLNETGRWMTVSRRADGWLFTEDCFCWWCCCCQIQVHSVMSAFPKHLSETSRSDCPWLSLGILERQPLLPSTACPVSELLAHWAVKQSIQYEWWSQYMTMESKQSSKAGRQQPLWVAQVSHPNVPGLDMIRTEGLCVLVWLVQHSFFYSGVKTHNQPKDCEMGLWILQLPLLTACRNLVIRCMRCLVLFMSTNNAGLPLNWILDRGWNRTRPYNRALPQNNLCWCRV